MTEDDDFLLDMSNYSVTPPSLYLFLVRTMVNKYQTRLLTVGQVASELGIPVQSVRKIPSTVLPRTFGKSSKRAGDDKPCFYVRDVAAFMANRRFNLLSSKSIPEL